MREVRHMSDDFFGDEYDDQPDYQDAPAASGPKALRDAYEREKDARKALEERLSRIEEESRKAKLADALKGAGVSNPDALGDFAKLIEPDKAGDFLTAVKAAMGLETPDAPQGVSEEQAAAMAAVSGEPAGTAPVTSGDKAATIASIDNEADFWAAIRS
jgi:hypothetical protein